MPHSLRVAAVLAILLLPSSSLHAASQKHDPIDDGIAALRAGRLDEAIQIFTSVLEDRSASADDRLNARLNRGSTYLLADRVEDAIADFSAAIAASPENAGLYLSRGSALGRKGDREGAFADFERALKLDPKYAEVYYNRARLRIALEETEQAITDLSTALRLKPAFAPAAITLANLYSHRSQSERAIEVLTTSLAAGDDPYVRLLRGSLNSSLQRFAQAVDDFSRVVELAPDRAAQAYSGRGNARVALNRLDDALRDFDAALDADPSDVLVRVNRANLQMMRGESDKAIADFTVALESNDAPAEVLFYRGCAFLGKGALKEAKGDLDRYAANHPDDQYGAMMAFVASARLGMDSKSALRAFLDVEPKKWPDEILHFLGGKTTKAAFLASIASASGDANQRIVEGHYYLGQECLIRGDRDCARRHFETVKATGLKAFVEHQGATAELRQLAELK